jgi:hypothetical protein
MTATRDLSFDTLQLEQDGRVLTARYSCPPFNFLTMAFIRDRPAIPGRSGATWRNPGTC